MTIALWCLLAAGVLPYLFAVIAKAGGRFTPRDNRSPREFLQALDGWPKRANWAQQNSFETFPMFAAAVLVAHLVAGPSAAADALALAFVVFRLLYGLCYLADKASARSLMWSGGIVCVVGLFVVAARV